MRMTIRSTSVIAVILLIVATVAMRTRNGGESRNTIHVALVGASIGQGWHLAEWPARVQDARFSAESIPNWQFDKSEAVGEILMRPARKFRLTRTYLRSLFQPPPRTPDIVILKECSSYFPGDLAAYRRNMTNWVSELRAKHIRVMLATVVPVTRTLSDKIPGKQAMLLEYNDWVRKYARNEGMTVLDLEVALRTDETGRYLRDELAASDGSHLDAPAYKVLDVFLHRTLNDVTAEAGN
jgi:hypothetical protein